MPRYDRTWALLAERATSQGVIDVETFVRLLAESGVSEDVMLEMLERDLETNGPVFGKFMRSIGFASGSTAMTAVRQGEMVGAMNADAELQRLTRLAGMEGSVLQALETADPEIAEQLEIDVMDEVAHTWICTLRNTCNRCLPLHGKNMTLGEWKERGLVPELMHQGWDSDCHCRLMPTVIAEGRTELVAPLKRVKVPGSKRTQRAIAQKDIDAALAARDAALKSDEGLRVLAMLGRALNEDQD